MRERIVFLKKFSRKIAKHVYLLRLVRFILFYDKQVCSQCYNIMLRAVGDAKDIAWDC